MVGGIILVLVGIACIASCFIKDKDDYKYKDDVVSSRMLADEVDREQGRKLPRINPSHGTANNYARMDKSWKSLPDFIIQLAKDRRK